MSPHFQLAPADRVQIPPELTGPFALTAAALITVGVLFRAWTASIERLIKRLENEIDDLRKEKDRQTDVINTFPPVIRDLGDEIRTLRAEGPGRWDGAERRKAPTPRSSR